MADADVVSTKSSKSGSRQPKVHPLVPVALAAVPLMLLVSSIGGWLIDFSSGIVWRNTLSVVSYGPEGVTVHNLGRQDLHLESITVYIPDNDLTIVTRLGATVPDRSLEFVRSTQTEYDCGDMDSSRRLNELIAMGNMAAVPVVFSSDHTSLSTLVSHDYESEPGECSLSFRSATARSSHEISFPCEVVEVPRCVRSL